jgi:peptidoglycan/LPS O-acetylase OafA/YrhL
MTTQALVPRTYYRADIDGLRGVAILLVVGFHAFPTVFPSGFIGVDVFFVVSGYLITQIITTALGSKSFSFVAFYRRRINRVFPALLVVLISLLVMGWHLMIPDDFAKLGKHVFGGAIFLSNLVSLSEFGYFDVASELKPLLHLWSLAIEEQFYLIWPIALYLGYRAGLRLGLLMCTLLLASFTINVYRSSYDLSLAFFALQTRAWELLFGALIGYLFQDPSGRGTTFKGNVLAHSGLILLGTGLLLVNASTPYPSGWALLPVFGTGLIIAAGEHSAFNKKLLSHRWIVSIGLISYPLYLWHWALLSFAAIIAEGVAPVTSVELRLGLIALSVALAWATYKYIETPIRRSHNTNFTAITLALLMVCLAAAGLAIYKQHGFVGQTRQPPLLSETGQQDCLSAFNNKTLCIFGNLSASQSILIYGDSHAQHLTAAVTEVFGAKYKIIFSYWPSCFFSSSESFKNNPAACQTFIELVKSLRGTKLEAVIRSQLWFGYPALANDQELEQALQDAAQAFDLEPEKVIIVGAAPVVDIRCAKRNHYFGQVGNLQRCLDDSWSLLQTDRFALITQNMTLPKNVYFVHPSKKLCAQGGCNVIEKNTLYYNDINHLNKAGAMLMMPDIANILAQ